MHIRIISEGSRDTEDWINDGWKLTFTITERSYILKCIKIEDIYILICNNISQYYSLSNIFIIKM